MTVRGNPHSREIEKELSTTGWTFFFMANPIRSTSLGIHRPKMVTAALTRLIANAALQNCNCLEIEEVATRSFLGILHVSVSGHARHIQKGMVLGK